MKRRWLLSVFFLAMSAGCQEPQEPLAEPESETPPAAQRPTLADALAQARPPQNAPAETLNDQGGELDLEHIKFTAPAGWGRKAASSGFVAAEYVLPRAAGDDADGRLTVSFARGTVEANIERWRTQFEGQVATRSQEQFQLEGLDVTLVDMSGDYRDQRGMMGPSVLLKNCRMLCAILPLEDQSCFVKAYGPQATMESHAAQFQQFVRTARKK